MDYAQCHGCGLCSLVCPSFQQGRDVRLTPHGHAKALQYGGEIQHEDVFSCILCGACDVICPQDIPLMELLLSWRREKTGKQFESAAQFPANPASDTLFLPSPILRQDPQRLHTILGLLKRSGDVAIAQCDGQEISHALECGLDIPSTSLDSFLSNFRSAKKLIVDDGLLKARLQQWLPKKHITGLGQALSAIPELRQALKPSDMYIIESRAYHSSFSQALPYYDKLQTELGCRLSLDLHRLAIPTGNTGHPNARSPVSPDMQVQAKWILQGHGYDRVVVENLHDYEIMLQVSDKPVIFLADVAPNQQPSP